MIAAIQGSAAQLGHLALALALGLLIGVERGWAARDEPSGGRVAGVRTFALLALAGGLAGMAAQSALPLVAVLLLLGPAVALLLGYGGQMLRGGSFSSTGCVGGMLTLAVGYLAVSGQGPLAGAVAAVTTLVLSLRKQLHGWVRRLDEQEIGAIARFALVALAVLPFLPDRSYGPFDAWNPRQLWSVVVLVCGFSFVGYLASKRFGDERGTLATAAAGSMVSSTAVTTELAMRLRDGNGDPMVLTSGIAIASAAMFVRVLLLAGFLAPVALPALAVAAVPGALVSLASAYFFFRKAQHGAAGTAVRDIPVRNPFDLRAALALMLLVMILTVACRWVLSVLGEVGLMTVLALSGTADVDSAIITLGDLPPGVIDPFSAGAALTVAVVLNTLFKAGVTLSTAGRRSGGPAALCLAASAAVAVLSLAGVALGHRTFSTPDAAGAPLQGKSAIPSHSPSVRSAHVSG